MKKSVSLFVLVFLALGVILTAGCVSNTPAPSVQAPDLRGNWTTTTPFIYSSQTGFATAADPDYRVLTVTNQHNRLLTMSVPAADRTYYAAVSDKNATRIFSDASYGDVHELLIGEIKNNGTRLLLSSVRYDNATGNYAAIFDPRVKEETTASAVSKPQGTSPALNLIGSWTLDAKFAAFGGDVYTPNETTNTPISLTITKQNGPVFCGTLSFQNLSTANMTGVLTYESGADITALIVTESGMMAHLRIVPDESIIIKILYANIAGVFITSDTTNNATSFPVLKTNWTTTGYSLLDNSGANTRIPDLQMTILEQIKPMFTIALSNGNTYTASTSPAGEITAAGISADRSTAYLTEGFIGTDGTLSFYTIVRNTTTNTPFMAVESIYTAQTA